MRMACEWGLGEKHIKGKLYCIQEGKNVGTVWEFLSFWDPLKGEVRMFQIGSDGTIGEGTMWRQDDGSTKSNEKFANPSGGSFEAGHHTWMDNGKMHTQSFDIKYGEWTKRRYYVWGQEKENEIPVPDEYEKIAFLIGEWHSEIKEGYVAKMRFSWAENKRMIKYQGTNPNKKEEPEKLEAEGIITYHGIKDQLVLMNTYLKEGSHLISEGHYEIDENGTINRPFICHYKAGDKLPWSDGAVAPAGGRSIEFKQIWTPIDNDSFYGDFYWKKNGEWVHPIKEYDDGRKEVWRRVE